MPRFIVIEGLDGAGTTTQAARLVDWFGARGLPVHRTFEPSSLAVGRLVRAALRQEPDAPGRLALPWLFAADRADHLDREIGPALSGGTHVVCDRYVPSSLAYQALEVPMDRVWALNETFPAPDLTVFLDVPVEVALGRVVSRGEVAEVYERRDLLERIAANYHQALARLQDRGDRIARIDGAMDADAVAAAIVGLVAPLVD